MASTKGPSASSITLLDPTERSYRDVLAALRIAQIYWFWLALELMVRPLIALNQLCVYLLLKIAAIASPALDPGAPPDLSHIADIAREPGFLFALLAVWALFALNARHFTHWLLWPVAAAVVLYNLHGVWETLLGPNADAYDGLRAITGDGRQVNLSDEITALSWAVFALYVGFHLHLLYIAFRAQRSIAALDPGVAALTAETAPREARLAGATRRLLYLPAALRHARRRLLTGALLLVAGVSNLINYWLILTGAQLAALLPVLAIILARVFWPGGVGAVEAMMIGGLCLLIAAITLTVAIYLRRIAAAFVRMARRFMRNSLRQVQALDDRAPVLFLRSFLDDQVALPLRRFSLEQWLLDASSLQANFDHIILEEATPHGPVVALGDPSDEIPPYGAARGYFAHADWQGAVARLCDEAAAVVLVLDETEGVAWEIAHLSAPERRARTLYLLAPGDIDTARGAKLMTRALTSIGVTTDQADAIAGGDGSFAFSLRADGEVQAYSTASRSSYAYLIALRMFLRGAV